MTALKKQPKRRIIFINLGYLSPIVYGICQDMLAPEYILASELPIVTNSAVSLWNLSCGNVSLVVGWFSWFAVYFDPVFFSHTHGMFIKGTGT